MYDGNRLVNPVGHLAINSWNSPPSEAIYFELYPTALFVRERAAAVFSPAEARVLASALNAVADMFEEH